MVDMAELLRDSLEAKRRRAQSELEPGKCGAPATCRREILDFTSWVQWLALYESVVQSRFPSKGKDMWAHLRVMASKYWRGPCYAWNDGKCTSSHCRFEVSW